MENFNKTGKDKMIRDVLASFQMDHIDVSPEIIENCRNLCKKEAHSLEKTLSKGVKNGNDSRR